MAHEQLAAALVQASDLIRERDRLAARVEALTEDAAAMRADYRDHSITQAGSPPGALATDTARHAARSSAHAEELRALLNPDKET